MRAEIEAKLAEIYAALSAISLTDPTLFGGDAGIQLFNFVHVEKKDIAADAFQQNVGLLAENALAWNHPTFCSGFSGIDWFFEFLCRKELMDTDDKDLICCRKNELESISLRMLETGNYDFLHGAIGIAWHLLYARPMRSGTYYSAFFALLRSLIDTSAGKDSIPNYDFVAGHAIYEQTNLGLAHGLPAILKFCLQCNRQNICVKESRELAKILIAYMLAHVNSEINHCYFSYVVSPDGPEITASRLAWCYGDLGAAFILYQAGVVLSDPELKAFSIKVLLHSTKRKTLEAAGVADAGICHGTAGIAHIYNKIWHYTKIGDFKEACGHWVRKTLDFAVYADGIAGFKRFDPVNAIYKNDYGLLEGVAGIGLVLSSCLTGDFNWDYCLMLNN